MYHFALFPILKLLFIPVAFFLLAANMVKAQQARSPVKYIHAEPSTINDELSQGLINCIIQDHFGFIWLGTMDGLNRSDGYHVSVFRHDPDDMNSISDNFITCVFEDSKNRLWVGTNTGGVNYFDYEKEQFVHITHAANGNNSLSDDRILSIQEDASGAIWIGTKCGLNKMIVYQVADSSSLSNRKSASSFFDTHRLIFKRIQFDPSRKELYSYRKATNKRQTFTPSFFVSLQGVIFVRTESNYYCIYPSENTTDSIVKLNKLRADVKEEKEIADMISLIRPEFDNETFLYLMASKYVMEIDVLTGTVRFMKLSVPGNAGRRQAYSLKEKTLWFILNFHLYQYREADRQMIEIKSPETSEEFFLSHATSLCMDRTGKIWVGTGGYGVLKFNLLNEKFHRVKSLSIHWLYAAASDKVFIREGDSVAILQKNMQEHHSLSWIKNDDFFKKIYKQLHGKYLRTALEDTNGSIWLQAQGIRRYDGETGYMQTFEEKSIAWPALYVVNGNEVWFADDTLLCKLNVTAEKQIEYPIPVRGSMADFYVETIYKDAQQIVWIGTTDGLYRFDENQQKWDRYSFRANDTASLSSNLILSICASADNKSLWIGTNGGGFNCFNKETGKFTRYSIHDGLANNVVYGILADETGNLWMSTNKGIFNFEPFTKKFTNYTVEDGLQGNEFNTHAYCKTKDGTMFFGGVNGYNYFDPQEINPTLPAPQIIITDVKSNGHSIDFRSKESPLSIPVYLVKKILLNFTNNTISFDFSSMDFKTPAHDTYQYMLEGVDKDWVPSPTNRSSVYSNLQPGRYVFKVKSGRLHTGYASLDIIILPPWYLTWWFMGLLVLIVTVMVYSFYKYNLNHQIKRYKDHQRIASDLHDEIGSTLSSIHIYSEMAISKMYKKPLEAEVYLKQISNSVENTIGSLEDIVWALKAEDSRFEDMGNHLRAAAVNICEANGYALQLHFDEQLDALKWGNEKRKNLFLIYKEAINNAMKYAGGKNLVINLLSAKNQVILSISDDGIGFDEKKEYNGNGLGNMRKRAKELNGELKIVSSPGKGTGVILQFSI